MLSANPSRIISLLRASGASRSLSAGLLASIGDLLGIDDPAGAIAIFDTMTDEQEAAARSWLSTSPAYRAALAALGDRHG